MAGRQLHRLSALRVAKEVMRGHYADGGGLYMQIADSGARSWVFQFKLNGRIWEIGLGLWVRRENSPPGIAIG